MRCQAYCTAYSYNMKAFMEYLQGHSSATLYRDVIHISIPNGDGSSGDVFYFSYGVLVCWGLTPQQEQIQLDEVKHFEQEPLEVNEVDLFSFVYGETAKISKDEITLPDRDVLTKLAFSHGIAQSVKLSTFELTIQNSFNNTKEIPSKLAKYGRIYLSKQEIRRKMGELFTERSSVNLRLDILDTPDFFWIHPELEHFYTMTANYLDIESRVEVLNHRLDVMKELFGMLVNELNHQHSSRLEWIIILLIVMEVMIALSRDVFHII
jgi:uncharacterized Rmd1/YagE family protein